MPRWGWKHGLGLIIPCTEFGFYPEHSGKPLEVEIVNQMRKLRLREDKGPAHSHTASKWQSESTLFLWWAQRSLPCLCQRICEVSTVHCQGPAHSVTPARVTEGPPGQPHGSLYPLHYARPLLPG